MRLSGVTSVSEPWVYALALVGRQRDLAMKALAHKQASNGGRVMLIYVTDTSNISMCQSLVHEWAPPPTRNSRHWYSIGPGEYVLSDLEALEISPNGINITKEGKPVGQMIAQVILHPSLADLRKIKDVPTEAKSFGTVSPRGVFISLLFCTMWFFLIFQNMVLLENNMDEDSVAWWRPMNHILNYAPCLPFLLEAWCTAVGCIEGLGCRAVAVGVVVTLLPCATTFVLNGSFSTFTYCVTSTGLLSAVTVLTCFWKRGLQGGLLQLSWGLCFLCLGFGGWIMFYGIGLSYIQINKRSSSASIVFLPLATAVLEVICVAAGTFAYKHRVYHLRDSEDAAWGDQGLKSLPVIPTAVHAYAETCRLSSVLASAVYSPGSYVFVFVSLLSLFLNVMNRQGWTRFLFSKMVARCSGWRMEDVLNYTAPTAISRVHDVAKIGCAYPRMVAPAVMGLVQLMTGRGMFQNTTTILALAFMFAMEIVEDLCILFEVLPCSPAPEGNTKYYGLVPRFSPYQSMVPVDARGKPRDSIVLRSMSNRSLLEPSGKDRKDPEAEAPQEEGPEEVRPEAVEVVEVAEVVEVEAGRDTCTSVVSTISSQKSQRTVSTGGMEPGLPGKVRRSWGQDAKVFPALRLWHLRVWPLPVTCSFIWIMNLYSICLLELLLGPGYVRGNCPAPISRSTFDPGFWQSFPLQC